MLQNIISDSFELDFEIFSSQIQNGENFNELFLLFKKCDEQRKIFRLITIKLAKDRMLIDKLFREENSSMILKKLVVQDELKNAVIDKFLKKFQEKPLISGQLVLTHSLGLRQENGDHVNQGIKNEEYRKENSNALDNINEIHWKSVGIDFSKEKFNVISDSPIQVVNSKPESASKVVHSTRAKKDWHSKSIENIPENDYDYSIVQETSIRGFNPAINNYQHNKSKKCRIEFEKRNILSSAGKMSNFSCQKPAMKNEQKLKYKMHKKESICATKHINGASPMKKSSHGRMSKASYNLSSTNYRTLV